MEPCDEDIDICNGETHSCYDCGGDGYVESDDWQDDEVEFECSTCNGTGVLPCPANPRVS